MVIAIIGENCAGKSTLAEKIKETFGGEIISGKDYLRMAKSESEAVALFKNKLKNAVDGENIIYVISEKEHIAFLPDGALKILAYADIETIKERFKERMRGVLPPPVEKMLVSKHGAFDDGEYFYRYDGAKKDVESVIKAIKER
jgi:adenylate kinase family enzyme